MSAQKTNKRSVHNKRYSRHIDQYLLKGKFRKNGFELWRYIFTGHNKATGEQKKFFIELYYVNPLVSPNEPVLSSKTNVTVPEVNIQDLFISPEKQDSPDENLIQPSYALVKVGSFGGGGRFFNRFMPASSLKRVKSEDAIKIEEFIFAEDTLKGSISVSERDILEHPEFLCSAGEMKWDLHFENHISSSPLVNGRENFWVPRGVKTMFAGTITMDGIEYAVSPRTSFGYTDKSWGTSPANPLFHLSSSKLVSDISGKILDDACFAVEGEYDGRLSVFVLLDGKRYELNGGKGSNKYSEVHDWSSISNENAERLHWSVGIQTKKDVIDIDIYCNAGDMSVIDYELPSGGTDLYKVLCGSEGSGEIRVYRKFKKNLVLLEHANVTNAVCEYGTIDTEEDRP